jgi:hypothetical protein
MGAWFWFWGAAIPAPHGFPHTAPAPETLAEV